MRGIIVNRSTEVAQMFISTARSLNRVGEEITYSPSLWSSYAVEFASLGLGSTLGCEDIDHDDPWAWPYVIMCTDYL